MDSAKIVKNSLPPLSQASDFSDLGGILLDEFPLGVFLFQGRRFPYVNRRAADILGRSVEELRMLESLESLVFSADYPLLADWFERVIGGEAESETQLFRVIARDGGLRRVLASARRMVYRGIPSILGTLIDVSEWLDAQVRLERERRLEVVGHMADSLGNDLNNLLSSVLGNASLLRESHLFQGPTEEQLVEIETGALQSADLVSRLMNVSTRRSLLQRPMNLNESVSRALQVLRSTMGRHITIRPRLTPDPKPIVGDPVSIDHVVLQLGLNACEAMPLGGDLKIETAEITLDAAFARTHPEVEPGSHMRLRVEDTGRGIAPELLDHIFDPFFTTKQDARGAGVGLTLAHNIVTTHGGCIDVRSWLGQGTTVDVYFPVHVPVTAGEPTPGTERLSGEGTVLIIDDEELARSTAARILQRHGYQVVEASGGQEGVRILSESGEEIKAVLLDLIMPGLSGRQTLERLRDVRPDVPVVLISGHSAELIDTELQRLRVSDSVQKPYRPVELIRKISGAVGSKSPSSEAEP